MGSIWEVVWGEGRRGEKRREVRRRMDGEQSRVEGKIAEGRKAGTQQSRKIAGGRTAGKNGKKN